MKLTEEQQAAKKRRHLKIRDLKNQRDKEIKALNAKHAIERSNLWSKWQAKINLARGNEAINS